MKHKSILLSIILTLFIFIITGCNRKLDNNLVENSPRVINHAMGRTTVPINPARVVTLTNEATEAMLILETQPVGAVRSLTGSPWWCEHIKNRMTGVVEVGYENNVDINKIASLNPDLIIGSKALHEDIYDKLSFIAPTIFIEEVNGEIRSNFEKYAEAVNKEDQGEEVIVNYNEHLRRVRNIVNKENLQNKKFAVIGFLPDKTYLFLRTSFIGTIFDQLELNQVEFKKQSNNQGFVEISQADFLYIARDSNIILHFNLDEESLSHQEEWLNDPVITNLTGTTLERIYKVNVDTFYTSNGILAANEILNQLENEFENYNL